MKLITSPRKVVTALLVIVYQTKQTFAIDQRSTITKEENSTARRTQNTCNPGTLYLVDQSLNEFAYISDVNSFTGGQVTSIASNNVPGIIQDAGASGPPDSDFIYQISTGNNELYTVNKVDGTATLLYTIIPSISILPECYSNTFWACKWTGLALDLNSGFLYGLATGSKGTYLCIINTENGDVTNVSLLNLTLQCGVSLAIDGNSKGFIHDSCDELIYSVDLDTGDASILGPTGLTNFDSSGMAWDYSSDTIFMVANNNDSSRAELRSVTTEIGVTARTTFLGEFQSSNGGATKAILGFAVIESCGYSSGGGSKSGKGSKTSKSKGSKSKSSKSKAERR